MLISSLMVFIIITQTSLSNYLSETIYNPSDCKTVTA